MQSHKKGQEEETDMLAAAFHSSHTNAPRTESTESIIHYVVYPSSREPRTKNRFSVCSAFSRFPFSPHGAPPLDTAAVTDHWPSWSILKLCYTELQKVGTYPHANRSRRRTSSTQRPAGAHFSRQQHLNVPSTELQQDGIGPSAAHPIFGLGQALAGGQTAQCRFRRR